MTEIEVHHMEEIEVHLTREEETFLEIENLFLEKTENHIILIEVIIDVNLIKQI